MSINPRIQNLIEKTTPDGTTTYEYGTLGELRKVVTSTQTITYKQNANNQRVAKLINGEIVEKYLCAILTTLLAIYDKDDNLIQRFEYADNRMPISMTQNGSKYYLHYDQVGSLRAVSDSSFNIIKEISYDTYGNILTDSNENLKVPFGFAGGLYDTDTKLTRFGYRDYDAFTGKWIAKDPIDFAGGDSNLYGYVLGDPVGFVDSSGLRTDIFIWRGAGYGTSAFGHVSIGINGVSYSWGPGGMDIRNLGDYISRQATFRDGIGAQLPLTDGQEQSFENFLRNYDEDNDYWFPGNVCTDPANKKLEELGFDFDSQIVPMSLYLELIRTRIIANPYYIRRD